MIPQKQVWETSVCRISLECNYWTKSANERTFLLLKSDISDFYTQSISDLNKSVKAGLFRAFTHTIIENTSDQMS